MRDLEEANLQRWKIDERLPGAGGQGEKGAAV